MRPVAPGRGEDAINGTSLTPEEYELHLKDLCGRLRTYLEGGGGDPGHLLKDAENVLELRDEFPDVFQRHEIVEGLVAELLARRQQDKFRSQGTTRRETPGCLLGWLRRKSKTEGR